MRENTKRQLTAQTNSGRGGRDRGMSQHLRTIGTRLVGIAVSWRRLIVCDNQQVKVSYYSDETDWVDLKVLSIISEIYPNSWNIPNSLKNYLTVHQNEWNSLEIQARGENFKFYINNKLIMEIADSRLKDGNIYLITTINTRSSSSIWFDNFALQER